MHKAISTKVQGKICLWQYTIMSIKLFEFSNFYVFLDFWHKSKKRLIKRNNVKTFKTKTNKQNTNFQIKLASQQKAYNQAKSQNIGSINAWICCNAYARMSTLLHPHVICVWGDIPIGLGTSVVAFKPSVEACQTGGKCINHLHHIHHSRITI